MKAKEDVLRRSSGTLGGVLSEVSHRGKALLSNTCKETVSLALSCHSTTNLTWLMASENLPELQTQRMDRCFYLESANAHVYLL